MGTTGEQKKLSGYLARIVAGVRAIPLFDHETDTTNLYLLRLCRSVVSTGGGALTGSWPISICRALGRQIVELPPEIEFVPMRQIAFRLADMHQISTLGAEAVSSSEHCAGPLCVWTGDDGPRIGLQCPA